MSILQGIGAVGGLLRGASSLVRELKRPTLSDEQFSTLLREQMNKGNQVQPGQQAANAAMRIERATAEFMHTRDSDGDGLLTVQESGFDPETFKRLDADGDGMLTTAELAKPHLEALKRYQNASNTGS